MPKELIYFSSIRIHELEPTVTEKGYNNIVIPLNYF